jgi:hypothetical protein
VVSSGCSPVMESQRPDPVDLSQFKPGESRTDVAEALARVQTGAKDPIKDPKGGEECDVYQLYTHGPGRWGKFGIAFAEAGADAVTLGLAEVLFTPTEIVTKSATHPVTFCYKDNKLADVTEK